MSDADLKLDRPLIDSEKFQIGAIGMSLVQAVDYLMHLDPATKWMAWGIIIAMMLGRSLEKAAALRAQSAPPNNIVMNTGMQAPPNNPPGAAS